ncbi:Arm DNA-binding domain-containing protein, partial [Salmonella enterica]|uniref:Arm DNA-binding domain-containing protein n=1 Tax=Salmonella enterica TaxID=28901 RepID=UPI0039A244A4
MKYRYAGKEKLLSIGVYPDVTLAEARDKRTQAKRILAAGDDLILTRHLRTAFVS